MSERETTGIRPSPDQLLTVIQRSEKRAGRGHFKIFLGMVAGVGKTYAMLQRAHQLKADGVDVVVGWVDTHGRKETADLLKGLEVFPRRQLAYKDVILDEMDLDGLLKRHPKVVLVDELAHTNAPQSRHAKRYQDVLELLDAGIDVHTTVNVQHLESRLDVIRQITGVTVQETLPDSVLDEANEIVLIDLPPEDLIERLNEGRVYPGDRIDVAGRNFFRVGNLTALREMALRTATGRADRELREFKTLHGIDAVWKSSSRLMVAVFASPYSESLIRWTRQIAETTGATWIGAYVDTGNVLSDEERQLLEKNTQLVRTLGGDFEVIHDPDLVEGLLRIARQSHVTQIIVGKTQRGNLRNLLRGGSIVSKLLRRSGNIDVYAVATEKVARAEHRRLEKPGVSLAFPWHELGQVGVFVALFSLIAYLVKPFVGYQSVGIIFLMAVVLSGLFLSRVSVFMVAVLVSLIHNFFFIPPLYTLAIHEAHDVLMLTMFFLAAISIGHLTARLRRQNKIIEQREDRAVQLFKLAQEVSESNSVNEVIEIGVGALGKTFQAGVAIILYSEEGKPVIHDKCTFQPDQKELAVAEWSRQNARPAGRFTDTLPSADALYFPLQSHKLVIGIVGLKLPKNAVMDYDDRNFAQALSGQLAVGLDRERLHEARQRLEVLEQADRLYRTLFDSVSHELKTPLTTIQGAASALLSDGDSKEYVKELSAQIGGQSERLLQVVNNMLDMTRLETGALKPKIETCDIPDILGPALKRVEPLRGKRNIHMGIVEDIKPLRCDAPLLVQALGNILHNAVDHTVNDGTIEIYASNVDGGMVEIQIRDDGPGLPRENPNIVFEKFYRERPERSGGVGLGLSIAKGFIEAQGGTISATNHAAGGALFTVRIPSC